MDAENMAGVVHPEVALWEGEQYYRTVFEQCALGIALTELSGKYLQVNQSFCNFFGYETTDLLQKTFQELTHADDIAESQVQIKRMLAGEIPTFTLEKRFICKSNQVKWANVTVSLVRDAANHPRHLITVIEDISDRKRAEAELRRQAQQQKALNRVIQAIRNSLDLPTIFSTVVAETGAFLKVDQVYLVQYLPDQKRWSPVAEYLPHPAAPHLKPGLFQPEGSLVDRLKKLEVVQINNVSSIRNECQDCLNTPLAGAYLIAPLSVGAGLWGSLILVNPQPTLDWQDYQIELVQTVADQLAIAIQQSLLYEQVQAKNQELRNIALLDGLTQIPNRRCFDDTLLQEWNRLLREGRPLSLILCDIDYFKRYNDTYGHPKGDKCLQQIAQSLMNASRRPADLVARYGGEEFGVILPNTNGEGAMQVAEFIRNTVKQLCIPNPKSDVGEYVTVSLGIASTTPNNSSSPQGLLQVADLALYQAKQNGRDQIYIHH
ncbi:MAG: diguanylate cyclase [Leptolyngbyaceae cyanobacterium MO_188.B28]|nr:diguanylate cyclase [Leptolyngbyaceae cyanobacterium MO_188.B28]